MKFTEVPDDVFEDLVPQNKYPIPEQHGPLRQFDKEMRCASRRCGSSTFFKVNGISYCMIHSLRELNAIIVRGLDGEKPEGKRKETT